MPLNGSGIASKPSGTTATALTTIESAKFNSVIDDIYSIFNTARPIAYGGTGATSAAEARTNLGLAPLHSAFTPASTSAPASLALAEDTDNGTNKVRLTAAESLSEDRTVTFPDKSGTVAMTSDVVSIADEALKSLRGVNAQTGTSYTFVASDAGKLVTGSNASAITWTVPPNSSVAFTTGAVINLAQVGAGQISIAAGSGVTIRSWGAKLKLSGQYSTAALVNTGTDEWLLFGDIAA